MEQEIHKLVKSRNSSVGYALDSRDGGEEIVDGYSLEILLGGHWIAGHVEYSKQYYFVSYADDSVCGLCTGMQVRKF